MSIQTVWQQTFAYFTRPIVVEPSKAALSLDAGLLPLRQFDERIGLTHAVAAALDDPCEPELTEHTFLEMVRSRVCDRPPRHLALDVDAVDDPAHGYQQLSFWHGYYFQNQ